MRTVLLALVLLAVTTSRVVAVSRQESTKELKKAVYSGTVTECEQVTEQIGSGDWYTVFWYARVVIPEIRLDNMPNISVFGRTPYGQWAQFSEETPTGQDGTYPSRVCVLDGVCFLNWKVAEHNYPSIRHVVQFTRFKIVITYESGTELGVENSGTGKSLDLEWHTDDETAKKIRGYKVQRREKQ